MIEETIRINIGDMVQIVRNVPKPKFNDDLSEGYVRANRRETGKVLKAFRNGWIVEVGSHEFFMQRKDLAI